MKYSSAFALVALQCTAAAVALSGCGQTGPLYMPKSVARPPVVQPAPTPTAVISTVPAQPSGSPSQ